MACQQVKCQAMPRQRLRGSSPCPCCKLCSNANSAYVAQFADLERRRDHLIPVPFLTSCTCRSAHQPPARLPACPHALAPAHLPTVVAPASKRAGSHARPPAWPTHLQAGLVAPVVQDVLHEIDIRLGQGVAEKVSRHQLSAWQQVCVLLSPQLLGCLNDRGPAPEGPAAGVLGHRAAAPGMLRHRGAAT